MHTWCNTDNPICNYTRTISQLVTLLLNYQPSRDPALVLALQTAAPDELTAEQASFRGCWADLDAVWLG